MQIEHLEHRHGGRITSIEAIAHDTEQRRAFWHFVGNVKWSDGSESKAVEISPVCLCRDPDDAAACAELDSVMDALNDYLRRNGEWRPGAWKPNAKRGREALS